MFYEIFILFIIFGWAIWNCCFVDKQNNGMAVISILYIVLLAICQTNICTGFRWKYILFTIDYDPKSSKATRLE